MKFLKRFSLFLIVLIGLVWLYTGSLIGVSEDAKNYLEDLKQELQAANYTPNYFVISGRRWPLDNWILSKLGNAASQSRHKKGEAIDLIILDINGDGKSNAQDVDIVYQILDKKIIKNRGGLGSYKNSKGFFNQQMIHFDSRGKRARWNR